MNKIIRPLLVCAALATFFLTGGDSLRAVSSGVVISQVYGGGGNTNAVLRNDYIELFNRGAASVNLSGMSVQYASTAGSSWQATALPAVTLAPGQYFLVQEASGGTVGALLPTADATGSINMAAGAGKVALAPTTTLLVGSCPSAVDFVGYGTGTNCFEGGGPTGTISALLSAFRASNGCTDTDNNSADFSTATPAARNTGTAAAPCSGDAAPTASSPVAGTNNVSVNATILINFSESVTASASAFSLECPAGTPQAFTQTSSPATSFTLTPTSPLPVAATCAVNVTAAQISDTDAIDPPDNMAADFSFTFQTANPVDAAPTVGATTPPNGATNVAVDANIVIPFSESVAAGVSSFNIQCGSAQSFTLSASPATSFTLDPVAALPYATSCNVTVTALNISDTDANDPPDHMAADFSFSFTTADPPPPGAANVIINEIDADTPGDDAAEFVELYDGGTGLTQLDGLSVVFYAGEDHKAYAAFDLDGYVTNAEGYFTLGNPGVPGASLIFNPGQFGLLQNGADAVALVVGNATDYYVANPASTPANPLPPLVAAPVTTSNVVDAIVYDTDDADDATLLTLLNAGQPQVNENFFGLKVDQSLQRCTNGSGGQRNTSTYLPATPTPNAAATCTPLTPRPPSDIVISQLYGGGGNSGATYAYDFVELYNRGVSAVDLAGWSLQYAAATGSGWDFNKTPLGGPIGPGEYYLIGLASSNTSNGVVLPPVNVSGLINMSGTTGKIALVDNYDALLTNCPTWNIHVRDLVGYGTTADCHEGDQAGTAGNAPAPSATKSLYRANGGATDTDVNKTDFTAANPVPRRTAPIVELGPNVVGSDPAFNGINAPRDATIQVIFTEPVDVVDPWFDISCVTSGQHTSVTQAGSGQSHYITPNENFTPGEQCTVTVFKDQIHDTDLDDSGPFTDTMPANYVWSFTVASGTAPPYPANVHLTLGNPSNAVADLNQFDNYLMEKPEFALSYNRDLGRPNWVSSHLSDEWFGSLARIDTFRADPAVPADWYRVQSFDFSGSGFDRGHMVPNADRDKETSVPINQATFLMSNMIAQAPDNNQGVWAALEGDLRTLAGSTNEIYIVTGPEGVGGTGSNGFATTTANGHVTVPANTWKVALILPKGTDDISRVTCATRTIAVIIPNIQGIRNDPWANYLVTVDDVEALTGYDFFSNLPAPIQACIEARKDGDPEIPLDLTPPSVVCDPADGVWHNSNVSLHCTATDSGSGLLNAGDASFSLSTSVGIAEDPNASTGSRTVCDVAGNCSTAGPIAGNRIDQVAPGVSCAAADGAWHAANVSIACTTSDGGSGLANAGDAAFSLVTSVVDDLEDANATSDLRNVCDAVGNCAQAGPVTGSKIDRKDPSITVATPPSGAVYQLGRVVNAAYGCTDSGSGMGTCAGTVANLAAIDTSSVGGKTFVVNATDAVGNTASVTVNYTVATSAISINNIPASPFVGGTFVPTFSYAGDGATSVTSSTPGKCSVSGGTVTFLHPGNCTLVAHAAATANFDAANGAPQLADIEKQTTTISINNIPAAAVYGGDFTPTFAYTGDGNTHARSETPAVCRVNDGVVKFVGAGTCTLTARASGSPQYLPAEGGPQSFVIAQATPTIGIDNIPAGATFGDHFRPTFDYSGHGGPVKSATSSTPSVCVFDGPRVEFVGVGTCTLTAQVTATDDYTAATGSPQSFAVGQATSEIRITNIPNKPKVGKNFTPNFRYDGDGATSVTSSTPAVCSVSGALVNFVGAGTCTLTAQAAATTNYAAATGYPESFTVKVSW